MSRPFVTIIIANRLTIRSVAFAGIADKLKQMGDVDKEDAYISLTDIVLQKSR